MMTWLSLDNISKYTFEDVIDHGDPLRTMSTLNSGKNQTITYYMCDPISYVALMRCHNQYETRLSVNLPSVIETVLIKRVISQQP